VRSKIDLPGSRSTRRPPLAVCWLSLIGWRICSDSYDLAGDRHLQPSL
jgi:hypothetical protein